MKSQEVDRAIGKLLDEVRRGLQHGFFEFVITCEIVKGGKRRLTLKAGKSYQFTIDEDEIVQRPADDSC
jgi:hypothetical protein